MADIMGLDIERLNHSCFRIKGAGKTVYVDPYKINVSDEADVIFITHEHFDHCNRNAIEKVCGEDTVLVVTNNCQSKVSEIRFKDLIVARPGKEFKAAGLSVEAVAAYNTNKFRSPGQPFHPKEDENCGYVIDFDGTKVYHMGDTDDIDEMESVECDIALVPVSGTYVMTAEEAARASKKLKPKVAVPMHYGEVVGSLEDAEKFRTMVEDEMEVVIS